MTRSARAARALGFLPQVDPTLAALALWCEILDGDGAPTVTSGDVIHIGQSFTALPLQEQIGVLGHHILHIALRHEAQIIERFERFGSAFDADTYTLCADAVINECLTRGGHALPRPAVVLSEVVRNALADDGAAQDDLAVARDTDWLFQRISAADHAERDRLAAYRRDKGFVADITPAVPYRTTDPLALEWRARLIRAQQAGGAAGRGVGPVLGRLQDVTPGRIPWEQRLRRLLAKAATPDLRATYRRPRSSWIAREAEALHTGRPRPVFEPARQRHSLAPRIVIGMDTSGSVGAGVLSVFIGEVLHLLNRTNAEIHLLCFDEQVYSCQKLTPATAISVFQNLQFRRDGGTSFVDVIAEARALDPSVTVLLTDAAGPCGDAPETPVIWACPVPVRTPPPFGTVLDLTG